jgi:hypothetical protein
LLPKDKEELKKNLNAIITNPNYGIYMNEFKYNLENNKKPENLQKLIIDSLEKSTLKLTFFSIY